MIQNKGIGGHHRAYRGKTDDWLTPPYILSALGEFDLDPCASKVRPWDTAKKHYTIDDDGLFEKWEGRVWLNAPYGPQIGEWLKKLVQHGNGIALIFARTETKMFFDYVWGKANTLLFIRGRLTFYSTDGVLEKGKPPYYLFAIMRPREGWCVNVVKSLSMFIIIESIAGNVQNGEVQNAGRDTQRNRTELDSLL